jgi:hypothetical protein
LRHNISSSSLKGFFQTNHAVLKVKFRDSGQGVHRAFINTNPAALAKLPVPFHLIFLLVIRPAGIGARNITGETASTLFMIDDWTKNPPVRGDEKLLLLNGSGRNRSEGYLPIFGNIYGHNFLLPIVSVESSLF